MALAAITAGILFKLQHWQGGYSNLYSGLIFCLIILLIATIRYIRHKDKFYVRLFKRIAIVGGLGLILALTPDLTLAKIQFRNHPNYIKAYEAFLKDPQNQELKQKMDLERQLAIIEEE